MTTLHQAAKALNQRRGLEAALMSEQRLRERVEKLERQQTTTDKDADFQRRAFMAFVNLGFWGRLKWLLRGIR